MITCFIVAHNARIYISKGLLSTHQHMSIYLQTSTLNLDQRAGSLILLSSKDKQHPKCVAKTINKAAC